MNAAKIAELLSARFDEQIEVSCFEAKQWFMDEKTKQTWREHLKNTLRRRLHESERRGVAEFVLKESKHFLYRLEAFEPPQTLYSFLASSKKMTYAGWAIDEEIALCLPTEK